MVEKHFTLSRVNGGPDSGFSLEPDEFKHMVTSVRLAEQALGEICYGGTAAEEKSRVFRRSLFVVTDMKAGELFTRRNVRCIRPGFGLPPSELNVVLGKIAATDIPRGTPLTANLISKSADHAD